MDTVALLVCMEDSDAMKRPPLDTKRKHRVYKSQQVFIATQDLDSVRHMLNFENAE